MIVDASAMIAILLRESDWEEFADVMLSAGQSSMSAVNYVEAGIVADRQRDERFGARLNPLIEELGVHVAPVSAEQARVARDAYRRYGKGRRPARLNFGDCFAYALSKATGEPLLYKGEDFAQTDVEPAR